MKQIEMDSSNNNEVSPAWTKRRALIFGVAIGIQIACAAMMIANLLLR